jgi:tRNA threonylcarbamoyl adenosine modification protein YjeE
MERFTSTNPSELTQVVDSVVRDGTTRERMGALVLALTGELGAGKTTFTQTLARALGITEAVTSPTFVVMKRYPLAHPLFTALVHVDLYRIDDVEELLPLRFTEAVSDPKNIVVVEWPERAPGALPVDAISISFTVNDDGSRTITYGG